MIAVLLLLFGVVLVVARETNDLVRNDRWRQPQLSVPHRKASRAGVVSMTGWFRLGYGLSTRFERI